jgi:hypothetical protein
LLRRIGLAPILADRQGRHVDKIEVGQHLRLGQFDGLTRVAGLNVLILAHDIEHIAGDTAHQRIRRDFLRHGTGHDQQAG